MKRFLCIPWRWGVAWWASCLLLPLSLYAQEPRLMDIPGGFYLDPQPGVSCRFVDEVVQCAVDSEAPCSAAMLVPMLSRLQAMVQYFQDRETTPYDVPPGALDDLAALKQRIAWKEARIKAEQERTTFLQKVEATVRQCGKKGE